MPMIGCGCCISSCKLDTFPTRDKRAKRRGLVYLDDDFEITSLSASVNITRVFTIFCVEPLVSVYRLRKSLTSMSLI